MKKLFLIPILLCLFMINVASTCSSDDSGSGDSPSTSTVTQNTTTSGNWRVTLFNEDGVVHTSYFSGYDFTMSTGGVITAINGSTTKTGTWNTYTDSGYTKFDIAFSDTDGPFEEISEDWKVLSSSTTKLELKHVSGGDGSIDLLTFEKN